MRWSAAATFCAGALWALFLFVALPGEVLAKDSFPQSTLSITRADGTVLPFSIELADTDARRELGLMYRKAMAPDHGMLFDFGVDRQVFMWMKNTVLPLDMLFIRANGDIASIRANAEPFSESIIDSGEAVHYVLELNAGIAAKLGIKPGDHVQSPVMAKP